MLRENLQDAVTFILHHRYIYQMDADCYNACVREWADALYRFAWKYTGNPEDARDVVQNSFAVLWEKKDRVIPEKAKAFLFQVAYRQSVDIYRKQRKIIFAEMPDPVSERPHPADLKRILDKALSQLEEQPRALVLLRDYEGYSYEEISQITGLSVTQVKVYLFRARKTLKNYLVSVKTVIE